jgi:multidrug efflux pump subunit AcrB
VNRAIAWLAHNPVAANLLMVLIIASGITGAATVTEEVFPELDLRRIRIEVPYLGAAPEEVESGVVVRIEEAIQNIDGVQQIVSTASEGSGAVIVELESGADSQRVLDEVTNNVQAITTFPVETEQPIIRELVTRSQVTDIAIAGATDVASLKTIAELVRDGLVAMPEVGQVEIVSVPPYEISIEVSEVALRRHGLTFDQVADAVRRSSLDLPGGSVRTQRGEILLRTIGQAYRGEDYARLPLWTRPDGSRLLLGDVATVVDGFAETDQRARFDDVSAVTVSVYRSGDQSALDVAAAVRDYVERAEAWLPEGITLTIWQDQSEVLTDRLAIMLGNGAAGFLLVFVVLSLFLEMRLAFWVSLGIPISFLGAFAVMPGLDLSINMVSCFAFILVLGIVVDDAIIVGENIYRHQERHGDGLRGAIDGAREIGTPVVYAVLTTVAAFLPLLFVTGAFGQMFQVVPLVVVPCLLFSLLESLGILPAHLAHAVARNRAGHWRRFQQRIAGGLMWLVRRGYEPALDLALRWRYVTAAIGWSTLVLTGGVALGGWTNFQFAPSIENEFMTASITMPLGTPAEATSEAVAKYETGAARLRARLADETGVDYFRHVATTIGDQPVQARGGGRLGRISADVVAASNIGEITVELAPTELRSYTSEQLGIMWREATGAVPEAVAIDLHTSLLSSGEDVNVEISGRDLDRLRAAADVLKERLSEYAGVYAIADSVRTGKAEIRLDIRPAAETLGLTLQDLGRQVRQAFYGEEAQRIQRGRDDVRVMVRYPREQRRSLGNLEDMRVRTPDGGEVPFSQVALVEPGRGFASIRRIDRSRAVNVTASVDPQIASTSDLIADLRERILPLIATEFPDVFYRFRGTQEAQEEAIGGLRQGFLLSLILIFGLLAIPLRSYAQPLIIMGAIPFGLVGALWGHVLMGLDVTFMSLLGFVALTGVVVNDSLIMVDFINRGLHPDRGADGSGEPPAEDTQTVPTGLEQAIRQAGGQRFRPIVLTSLTTFAGLIPMLADRSMQAAFFIPMAVSLAFGVLFATFITLFLVPIAYAILDDVQRLPRRLRAAGGAAVRASLPAPGA